MKNVIDLDRNFLMVISQLNVHDNWKETKEVIENHFTAAPPFSILANKALLQMDDRILGILGCNGKWMHIGPCHLQFEA